MVFLLLSACGADLEAQEEESDSFDETCGPLCMSSQESHAYLAH